MECEVKLGGGGTPFSGILSELRLLVMNPPAKECLLVVSAELRHKAHSDSHCEVVPSRKGVGKPDALRSRQ